MIKINQISCSLEEELSKETIARKIKCRPNDILSYEIERRSLDARKEKLHYSYSVLAEVKNEKKYLRLKDVGYGEKITYENLHCENMKQRPVVAGFGPAGMFAALILAEGGCRPIVIERGKAVEERTKDVQAFFQTGILNPESNVQYGEGGAGTFSDGKLTTRSKDPRIRKVFREFVEAGAQENILYDALPHVGTDVLTIIVRNIRNKIIRLGGEIHFETKLERLDINNHKIQGVYTSRGYFPCEDLILCIGHSASDSYEILHQQGVQMMPKDFAAGVRVEHLQSMIDQNQYGIFTGHPSLHAASYRLTYRASNGRGVYSFCMCPGGMVIPSSSEEGYLVVNGMSNSDRSGKNANSAILVQVYAKDFDKGNPLDGFAYQKKLEKGAFRNGYKAPSQNISDYLVRRVSQDLCIDSSYPRGVYMEDLHALFPDEINLAMEEALNDFDHKIKGFGTKGIMTGMESRSSSPVRLSRNEEGVSVSCEGLYPCGEGAGYAGGIVSSAVDGIRQAENVIKKTVILR
ncbi:MAG: hypothetical protein IKR11_12520 [Solobacterium sp.]|nr:hypothetical protein [Solobacterium sp.]